MSPAPERDQAARDRAARERAERRAARKADGAGAAGAGEPSRPAAPAASDGSRGGGGEGRRGLIMLLVGVVILAAGLGAVLARGGGSSGGASGSGSGQAVPTDPEVSGGGRPASAKVAADGSPATTTPVTDAREPASWPLRGAAARAKPVPILMYHLIAVAPADTAFPGLWVPPAQLREQVATLKKGGFTGVTLGEVWKAWHGTGRLPARPVVLSFDDGDLSQVLGAGPVLKEAGWPGVLNLTVSHLGKGGIPMWGAKRLIKQGWEVDSHTIDHLDVTTLDPVALKRELVGSRVAIKNRLGVNARFFCYPAGRNDATSQAAVKAAGYLAATTVQPGLATSKGDPFTLPRIRVNPGTSGAALVAQATGRTTPPPAAAE